jgi:mitochondrial import receptor subunit TOM40
VLGSALDFFSLHFYPFSVLPVIMAEVIEEKPKGSLADFFTSNAVVSRASSVLSAFQDKRQALGLSNPGSLDNISKEVDRDVFLNNFSFTGLRADITKIFGAYPLFHISHQLSTGSQSQPPYAFSAMYGSSKACRNDHH